MKMSQLIFHADNCSLGMKIETSALRELLKTCAQSGRQETGGILWGYYDEGLVMASVTKVSGPPLDSVRGNYSFVRGVRGVQEMVSRLWNLKRRQYYLGEWHFHPYSVPTPSTTDISQMISHANDNKLSCPEPLLVIVGGNPKGDWSIHASLFERGGTVHTLRLSS